MLQKPNLCYFRVFGCKCFIHNNGKDNLEKFYAKSDEGIFLGYSTTSKAYRIFNKKTLVVEESTHVLFDESNNNNLEKNLEDDENILENKEIESNEQVSQEDEISNHEENEEKYMMIIYPRTGNMLIAIPKT